MHIPTRQTTSKPLPAVSTLLYSWMVSYRLLIWVWKYLESSPRFAFNVGVKSPFSMENGSEWRKMFLTWKRRWTGTHPCAHAHSLVIWTFLQNPLIAMVRTLQNSSPCKRGAEKGVKRKRTVTHAHSHHLGLGKKWVGRRENESWTAKDCTNNYKRSLPSTVNGFVVKPIPWKLYA